MTDTDLNGCSRHIEHITDGNQCIECECETTSGVVELPPTDPRATVCGECGRGWDDSISTSGPGYFTPVPAGRCPFEYEHMSEEERHNMQAIADADNSRGHKFLPSTKIPKLLGTEDVTDKTAYIHYFIGDWDWYILELNPETQEAFGLVFSMYTDAQGELGYVNLEELALVRAGLYKQPVERDVHWEPTRISEIRKERESR